MPRRSEPAPLRGHEKHQPLVNAPQPQPHPPHLAAAPQAGELAVAQAQVAVMEERMFGALLSPAASSATDVSLRTIDVVDCLCAMDQPDEEEEEEEVEVIGTAAEEVRRTASRDRIKQGCTRRVTAAACAVLFWHGVGRACG